MNGQILIDSLVRQLTVLIAQLATSGGVRAPIAHIANQVFVDLSSELHAQGVSRKVSADMFGMALRAYQRKLRRLTSSHGEREQTLWRGVLEAVAEAGSLSRQQIMRRFGTDDEAVVRGVLHDLVEGGVLACSGTGPNATYWAVSEQELTQRWPATGEQGLDELLWAIVYRGGRVDTRALASRLSLDETRLQARLDALVSSGRLTQVRDQYEAQDFSVPLNSAAGWEAAVFDHVQAMVQTICQRLSAGAAVPAGSETVGGSTYSFDVWDGHPLAAEVQTALARFRAEHTALRERVEAFNREHGLPAQYRQVVVYGGQCLLEREKNGAQIAPEGNDVDD
ncbi:MAG: hypothetical protein ACHQ53_16265 [Polyangiales bacterium]